MPLDRLPPMTFTPKVWNDVMRRVQHETPDFAFDAWIAPLEAKVAASGRELSDLSLAALDAIWDEVKEGE